MPRIAVHSHTQGAGEVKHHGTERTDRDALRYNGAQERGFAFGRTRHVAVPVQVPTPVEVPTAEQGGDAGSSNASANTTQESANNQASGTGGSVDADLVNSAITNADLSIGSSADVDANSQATSYGGDTNAVVVTKGGSFNINITITEGSGKGSKGTINFEEGGSYSFSLSDHPGAKYAIVGLEGGNGITNPHNLKGTIFLNAATQQNAALVNKLDEFLSKRDEISSKVAEKSSKPEKSGKITIEDLEQFNLLATPDVGILNIQDDRFDHSKFTNKEVLSLKVAAKLSSQDALNSVREDDEKDEGRGLKLGHQKDGFASYGRGLKLGHETAPGILAYYV